MKNINKILAVLALAAGFAAVSCEDEPDRYRIAEGIPEVHYIRPVNVEAADSLLTGAYMDLSLIHI